MKTSSPSIYKDVHALGSRAQSYMIVALLGMPKSNLCLFLYSVVEDTYHTVVYKELSAFKWIDQASTVSDVNNLKWILKVDDDVLLNIGKLKQFLDRRHRDNQY